MNTPEGARMRRWLTHPNDSYSGYWPVGATLGIAKNALQMMSCEGLFGGRP